MILRNYFKEDFMLFSIILTIAVVLLIIVTNPSEFDRRD